MDAAPQEQVAKLRDAGLYLNRELSLLEFHRRVLAQTVDPEVPLLERLRFLTISSSILDEFFEIRVSGLKEQVSLDISRPGADGMGPLETLRAIREQVLGLVSEQYRVLNMELLPDLAEEGIHLLRRDDWDDAQAAWAEDYFEREVEPVLSPVGLDPAHPFPRILNKSLNFIVTLSGKDAFGRPGRVAVLQAPRLLPRVIQLPRELSTGGSCFTLLSSIIIANVHRLFPGMKVVACHQFRVTRNSDLWVDEEEVQDLMSALKGELSQRHYSHAVRLEVSYNCPDDLANFLLDQFHLQPEDLYRVDGPVNLHRIEAILDRVDRAALRYPPLLPAVPPKLKHEPDIFATLRRKDLLLHHPYESFGPVVELVEQAADDPEVLAIKLTIYRTGMGSPLGEALLRAARKGKEVTAIVELRARFDEEANIDLASRLQEAGAKVVYGIVGYKAHCKMLLVVRREGKRLRRYCHLGTGNYHPRTARQYTDFSYLTADPVVGEDVHNLFQQLTGLGRPVQLERLLQTPFQLQDELLGRIEAEAEEARAGRPAAIRAKINSLVAPDVIEALYAASCDGVEVDLVVRGICCLRPGVPGVSENIRVRSIVGRFLEHHRVFHFHNAGDPLVLCSSADWMPRNLARRVEVAFPLPTKKLRQRVLREALDIYLEDNVQAWEMQPDGSYHRCRPPEGTAPLSAQEWLLERRAGIG